MSQISIEEMVRKYSEEETVRMMKVIMKNNRTMLKLQKQIMDLQVVEEERKKKQRKRQEEREQEKREYEKRWEEKECHKLYSACISTTSRLIFTN